ncbi:MATE family efflux transporter [Mariniblastus sp.]|nr:MATE family efflux transporter [Mariniblastus sp.]
MNATPRKPPQSKDLTTGPILWHIRDIALPSSIGLFFQTMYNVVDSFWAGQLSTVALAALGLSFPVFLLIIATGGGLSRGASALIANAIGAGETEKQKRFVAQSYSLGLLLAAVLTTTGLLVATPIFRMMGAEGEYLSTAQAYMTPIFCGAVFFIMASLSNAILIASGDSITYGKVLVCGFLGNLVLDPWFMFGGYGLPAMGIAGIGWATVILIMLGSSYMVWTVIKRGLLTFDPWQNLLPDWRVYGEILQQALPASFNILSVALGFFVTTFFLKQFGETAVAAFGVTTRIEQIGLLTTVGLYSAIMALVGQNNGAGNFARVHETMKWCNRIGLTMNLTISLLMFIFAEQLMRIFTSDQEVISMGVTCLRVIMPIEWSYVMTSTHLAMLQAVKRPMYGLFESILRKVLLPLPCLWICVTLYQLEIDWVWYCVAATNVAMTIVTVFYAQVVLRRLK